MVISILRSSEEKCQSLEDNIRLQKLSSYELTKTNAELEVYVVQNNSCLPPAKYCNWGGSFMLADQHYLQRHAN